MSDKKSGNSEISTNLSLQEQINVLRDSEKEYETKVIELQQRSDIHYALNEILQISILPVSLNELLDKVLHLILDIPWLAIDKKGSIFLVGDDPETLELVVEYNLSPELLVICKKVPFGTCLCGLTAQTKQLIFKNCVDDDHSHKPEGMKPHGHYCVPILGHEVFQGVLNLYVKHGHQTSTLEQEFLLAVTNAMAGIIERKKLEEQLLKRSYTDELTGLPNRRYFYENLARAIARCNRSNLTLAVLFIDLNGFKEVNDQYGHDIGDSLLKASAERMIACLRKTDSIARIGGDEFLVMLDPTGKPCDVDEVGSRLCAQMLIPFEITGQSIQISISVGTSMYPRDGSTVDEILKHADSKMYVHKSSKSS